MRTTCDMESLSIKTIKSKQSKAKHPIVIEHQNETKMLTKYNSKSQESSLNVNNYFTCI